MKTRVIQDEPETDDHAINGQAPVVGASETEISAAPEVVWDVLSGIEAWPTWNPEVRAVSMHGGLAVGSDFRWKAGPGTITSTLQRVDRPRVLAWTGSTFGIKAIHVHVLEARGGNTFVRSEESYDGLVVRVFRGLLQQRLEAALADGLRHLKVEAERRATHQADKRRS